MGWMWLPWDRNRKWIRGQNGALGGSSSKSPSQRGISYFANCQAVFKINGNCQNIRIRGMTHWTTQSLGNRTMLCSLMFTVRPWVRKQWVKNWGRDALGSELEGECHGGWFSASSSICPHRHLLSLLPHHVWYYYDGAYVTNYETKGRRETPLWKWWTKICMHADSTVWFLCQGLEMVIRIFWSKKSFQQSMHMIFLYSWVTQIIEITYKQQLALIK